MSLKKKVCMYTGAHNNWDGVFINHSDKWHLYGQATGQGEKRGYVTFSKCLSKIVVNPIGTYV